MWRGSKRILLDEYLKNRERLFELQKLPQRLKTDADEKEIAELENKIKKFIDILNIQEMRSLILMNLNIDE